MATRHGVRCWQNIVVACKINKATVIGSTQITNLPTAKRDSIAQTSDGFSISVEPIEKRTDHNGLEDGNPQEGPGAKLRHFDNRKG